MFMPQLPPLKWWQRLWRWILNKLGLGYRIRFTRVVIPKFTRDISEFPDIRSVFTSGPSMKDTVATKFHMEVSNDDVLASKPGP